MKKILLFILFMPFISFSQFNYGVKGSFILANLKSSDNVTVDTKAKPSYSIGAFTEYKFNSIALELSVSFLDAGAKGEASQRSSFDDIAEYGDFKYSLKSIFIELLGKYYITEKINFKAGPYMGIITSAEYDIPNQDLNDFWKKNNDFGLAFGAEYYIYEGFFAEVKYNLGLTNLFTSKTTDFVNPINNTDASIYRNEKVKNRIFQIGIGYKF